MANKNKNKRRNNKKEKKDVSIYGLYVKLLSETTTTMTCYHGSAIEKFSLDHEYSKTIHDYFILQNECSKFNYDGTATIALWPKFNEDEGHMQVMEDEQFGSFIFAFYSQLYLNNKDAEILNKRKKWGGNYRIGYSNKDIGFATEHVMEVLLKLGLHSKYDYVPKTKDGSKLCKFCRDIANKNKRGIINCLARETKEFCLCMNQDKAEAKNMEKVVNCHGCNQFFPKEQLLKCNGCDAVFYHNRQCQIDHWPRHKRFCKEMKNVNTVLAEVV
mmetsp:Transcript_34994/g.39082  ORF Transcript_34994/g.39082 Transcript_34994/m.39082 type:complete len:272 (+) Transcript_34994:700-1515(+)